MKMRIYADFNSLDNDGWCWCLRYEGHLLNEVEKKLELHEGQAVVLFYEDPAEEFEFDATLSLRNGHGWRCQTSRHIASSVERSNPATKNFARKS